MPNDFPDWNQITGGSARKIGELDNVGTGDIVTQTIALPPQSQGIGYLCETSAGNVTPQSVTITGVQTGAPYVSESLPNFAAAWADELFPEDSQVQVQVVGSAGANPSKTDVHAYSYNPRARIAGTSHTIPAAVTEQFSSPAPWQGPDGFSNIDGVVGNQLLRAHGATGQLRTWGWQLEIDQQTSGTTVVFIEDDIGGSGHRIAALSLTGAGAAQASGYKGGEPLGAGRDLHVNLAVAGAGANVRVYVGTSSG